MKTNTKVSEATALKILEAVRERYHCGSSKYGPELRMDFDWFGDGERVAIVWEGGPYEWAPDFSLNAEDVPGVFFEAMTSWALGIYPA